MIKPYEPFRLPLGEIIDLNKFMKELLEANKLIGIYQVLLKKSKIDPELLLIPIRQQEAIQSTRIEGTQVTLDDLLEYGADENKKTNDIQEVLNYYEALKYGEFKMSQIPISTRLIKEMHKILLEGDVRGKNRNPGGFRTIQNFIGPEGCTMETASFIPPEPQRVSEFMSNLEKYINEPSDDLHDLVRIAIIHAQFETIHPFLDGNGRIGRILIPLYLYDKNFIDSPNFFISESLEKDKFKYYRLLNDTRVDSVDLTPKIIQKAKVNWNEWIKFFIEAMVTQANKNIELIENIDKLYEKTLGEGRAVIKSERVIDLIDVIFKMPIFTKKKLLELIDIPSSTLGSYLNKLEEKRVIYSDGKRRNRKYYFYDLIDILRSK